MNDTLDRRLEGSIAPAKWWLSALMTFWLSLALVSVLCAQPVLLQSVPAREASVTAPPKLVLTFNGRVVAHLSSVAPGQYRAEWKVRAVDGQVTDGILRFTVIEAGR